VWIMTTLLPFARNMHALLRVHVNNAILCTSQATATLARSDAGNTSSEISASVFLTQRTMV